MPRAPRRCAKASCNNIQPCPVTGHQRGWRNPGKTTPLPHNWGSKVNAVKKRDRVCVICGRPGASIDHIIERTDGGSDDFSNLRLLCKGCHDNKTQEARRKRRKNRRGGR